MHHFACRDSCLSKKIKRGGGLPLPLDPSLRSVFYADHYELGPTFAKSWNRHRNINDKLSTNDILQHNINIKNTIARSERTCSLDIYRIQSSKINEQGETERTSVRPIYETRTWTFVYGTCKHIPVIGNAHGIKR